MRKTLVLMATCVCGPLPLWPRSRTAPNQFDDAIVPNTFNSNADAPMGGPESVAPTWAKP